MKLALVLLLLIGLAGSATLAAQEPPAAFLRGLELELARNGWTDAEIAQFRASAEALDWAGTDRADPRMIAWALELGMSEEALATQERTRLALALAVHTSQMLRLGYAERDVAASVGTAVRAAVQEMTRLRNDPDAEGDHAMVRTRLMQAIEDQTRLATRVRQGEQAGNTYRVGEAEPGVPLRPDVPPMPGPAGPGDGPNGPGN